MQLLNAVGVEVEYLLCDYFRGMSDLRLWYFWKVYRSSLKSGLKKHFLFTADVNFA
jgi:hypothetical protein